MSIVSGELKQYQSAIVSDTSGNGGRISAVELLSGVKNNVFPDGDQNDRLNGLTNYRKVFHKVENDDEVVLSNAGFHMSTI